MSLLTYSLTPTEHTIRNLIGDNIQDDLSLIKNHHGQPKVLRTNQIYVLEKQLLPFEKSVLEKGLNFCPEIPAYEKLKLMDNLFWFCRNLEFCHEHTETDT